MVCSSLWIIARDGNPMACGLAITPIRVLANTRIGVIANPHAIGFPSLAMIHREEHTIDHIAQTITQSEIDITITKGPGHFCAQFIF